MIGRTSSSPAFGSPGHGGARRHAWRMLLACVGVTMGAFAQGARAAGPVVSLVTKGTGEFLTESVSLSADGARKQRTVTLGTTSRTLGPGQFVYYAGGTVGLVTQTEDATVVELFDSGGRALRTVSLAPGLKTLAFGKSVASYAPNLHAPGIAYLFDVNWPGGTFRLERKGRTVTNLLALEAHLAISSRNADGEYETEVINGSGQVDWTFSEAGMQHPRIAVRGDQAVAVFTGRPDSVLQFAQAKHAAPRRLVLNKAVMTNVAFLTDGSGVFVWGLHDAAWVDPDRLKTRWQSYLGGDKGQLANGTSFVAAAGKTIPTLTRKELPDGSWRVGLTFLSLANGSVAQQRTLYETGRVPTHVRRSKRGTKEYLVLPDRVYTISSGQEGGR